MDAAFALEQPGPASEGYSKREREQVGIFRTGANSVPRLSFTCFLGPDLTGE
jgi:hypothetical protein